MKKRSVIPGDELFNSRLSFKPLVNALKRSIENGKPGASGLYSSLITELAENPRLLQPITDLHHFLMKKVYMPLANPSAMRLFMLLPVSEKNL